MAKCLIPIYSRERNDGLELAIAENSTVAYLSPVVLATESTDRTLKDIIVANQNIELTLGKKTDFDLYPIYTILATTGWNNNDDVFDKQETWVARYTPEDKPFNQGHVPNKIIGHITGSIAVDENHVIIPDVTTIDELPNKFHILTAAVIYKHINSRDPVLQAEAAELIEGIKRGDWYVSMEALFSSFDYGLTTASGEQQIVVRNEATAFLTKHLRIYKGDGEYNGCKVGRVLRNITFSGKGLVKTPANPESVIFNDAKQFVGVLASLNIDNNTDVTLGEKNMSTEPEMKALQEQLAQANRKLEELGTQQVRATLTAKDIEVTKLQTVVAEQIKKIEELTASYNGAVKAKEDAEVSQKSTNAANESLKTERDTIRVELDTMKTQAQMTNRISTLVDKGVDKTAAEALVAKFAGATDETFAEIVNMQSELVEAKKKVVVPADKGAAKADETADPKGEAAAEGADLGGAKPDADPNLAAGDVDKNVEVVNALASFFEQTLSGTTKK